MTIDLRADWGRYLQGLSRRTGLPMKFQATANEFWAGLESALGDVPIPRAGPTPQGSFIMSWDRGRHHFETEIFENGQFEWFYLDRETDYYEGQDGDCQAAVLAAVDRLRHWLAAKE